MPKALALLLIALILAPTSVIFAETPEVPDPFAGCSQSATTSTEVENTLETPQEPHCDLLVLNGGSTTVLENELTGTNAVVTTTSYMHGDHLGGTNVTSDENGLANEIVDFYPYGAERFRDGDSQDQRQFAGTERDQESNLDYMINRYYSSDVGKFLSQDPVFWEIGQTRDGQRALLDPQLQNSYSYSRDNPVTLSDPEGRIVPLIIGAGLLALTAYDAFDTGRTIADPNASLGTKLVAGGLFLTPVGEIKAGIKGLSAADNMLRNAISGARREAQFGSDLAKQFPDASIQREVYLRNADGTIAKDPFTGEGRRIDFAVIQNGRVQGLHEVTSQTADKATQTLKEDSIRQAGGTFIKDRQTGNLINASQTKTQLNRVD
ncbi:MAG: Rhs-related transmembrane protein, YD repeat protein [Candidatus Kaiserbacteria bacterium GW2011_GWC2_49_12]|uniref:Rhs-related transmembrane protein, YD repeat protein n=3 Tax=Candidatus Kaiseribacteriota TaxID=1752734 RepID=A0A0G1WH17_9BACT|nr:MAG: Rhs-related transmembrane protein, YD repeat protein [Candidatus Kaiserbacteria bacterium GW2011_GWC2_49_12]KKW18093.1 MAG: Rhs-related transmembrane protein, YD repeat protein [Candidatus Kaiserbacteria bacterium GW2011_GWB1_50_17]OGG87383.1 MAG: hypothetical protein A3H15_02475 [Candidatus Kaiserbacteria bacterium RIFCSPLOWO2_12_FULL_50_28]HCM43678.1 hypothetical protein [Candidatus Kaiserbacteria bacterium]